MKYIKMLGLLAVAAASLMALAGTASATTITSSTGATPTIIASTPVGATATLHNAVGTISCDSNVTGTVTSHGVGVTAAGHISTLSFTNCSGGTVHVINAQGDVATPGTLEVHAISPTGNGTLTSKNAVVTVTMFGVECGYTTSATGTDIGEVVGGEHAVLKIKATLSRTHGGGGVFCGSTGNWTGEYKVSHPTDLTIH